MGNFKKARHIMMLAVAVTALTGTVAGCAGQGNISSARKASLGERLGLVGSLDTAYETSREMIGTDANVEDIYINSSCVDVKICSAREAGKSVPDGKILIEKKVGQHTPDVDVSVENGVLNIMEPVNKTQKTISNNSMVSIYLSETTELKNISVEDSGDLELSGKLTLETMTIDTAYSYIDIIGNLNVTSDVSVKTELGDINIEQIICGGSLNLNTDSGDIECFGKIQGDLSAETGGGDILVSGTVTGNTMLSTYLGFIELDDITCSGNLSMNTGSGDIEFSGNIVGSLTAETEGGDITASDTTAGNVEANTYIGTINLEDVSCDGSLTLYTGSGDIEVSGETKGTLNAKTEGGDIYATCTPKDDVTLLTSHGYVSVSLSGNVPDYNYDLFSGGGDIYLNDETASSGIRSKVKMQNDINAPSITVSTDAGDITIETEEYGE